MRIVIAEDSVLLREGPDPAAGRSWRRRRGVSRGGRGVSPDDVDMPPVRGRV